MRIRGYWGEYDAPYLQARLICLSSGLNVKLSFLLDTGASNTVLLDRDAQRLGVDYSKLTHMPNGTVGIGGVVDTYVMRKVRILFVADTHLHEAGPRDVCVLRHRPRNAAEETRIKRLPSVIGRDILNEFDVELSRRKRIVHLRR